MPSASEVKDAILDDLQDAKGRVVVLTGRWGCGKTYLWQNSISPAPVVTVSLFGVESMDECRNKLATGALLAYPKVLAETDERLQHIKQSAAGVLKQAGRVLGQALDSWAGTSAFASKIDYLELVPDGVVFCIDDIERSNTNITIRSLLGVVNFLAEIRHCSVILVMDGEQMNAEDSSEFKRFRERVVYSTYTLESDLQEAYDRVAASTIAGTNIDSAHRKKAILDIFARGDHTNLRTLHRCLALLRKLADAQGQDLSDQAILFTCLLVLENAKGELRQKEHYDFSTIELLWQASSNPESEQGLLVRKYYADISEYRYFSSIHSVIYHGILDAGALEAELSPRDQKASPTERLIARTQSDEFGFLTDREYQDFVADASTRLLATDEPLTAKETTILYGFAAWAAGQAGIGVSADTLEAAETHMRRAASSDDQDQRQDYEPITYRRFGTELATLLDIYEDESRKREQRERLTRLKTAIDHSDIGSFSRQIHSNHMLLEHVCVDPTSIKEVVNAKQTRFRHRAIDALISELSSYAKGQFPWMKDAKTSVRDAIESRLMSVDEEAEKSRLKRSLTRTDGWFADDEL